MKIKGVLRFMFYNYDIFPKKSQLFYAKIQTVVFDKKGFTLSNFLRFFLVWKKNYRKIWFGSFQKTSNLQKTLFFQTIQPFDIVLQKINIKNLEAGNATRTRDILLGKEVFYRLNYTRNSFYSTSKKLKIQLLHFSFFSLVFKCKMKNKRKKTLSNKKIFVKKKLKKKSTMSAFIQRIQEYKYSFFFQKCRQNKKKRKIVVVFFFSTF